MDVPTDADRRPSMHAHHPIRTLLVLVSLLCFVPGFARASPAGTDAVLRIAVDRPGPTPCLAAPGAQDPAPDERGWKKPLWFALDSPVFHDLDGDGTQDVIAPDTHWRVFVWDHQGALRPGWPRETHGGRKKVAIADVDRDGRPDIVAVSARHGTTELHVMDSSGEPLPGFPVTWTYPHVGEMSCPVVVDLDSDGKVEIGVTGELGLYFYEMDGSPMAGWPYLWDDIGYHNIQWCAPAVGDIDNDGRMEVVAGKTEPPFPGVFAFESDGTLMPGFPVTTSYLFGSPALADLDGDSDLEIIAQEGCFTFSVSRLHVLHHTGERLPGWPRFIGADVWGAGCSPAIADVDADGTLDIVTLDGAATLHVLRPDGSHHFGFPLAVAEEAVTDGSPSVLDVDGDGRMEIFLVYISWVRGVGEHRAGGFRLDGGRVPGFPKTLYVDTYLCPESSLDLADLEGDGDVDAVAIGTGPTNGLLSVWEIPNSVADPLAADLGWKTLRRDPANHGCRCADVTSAVIPIGSDPGTLRVFPNPLGGGGRVSVLLPSPEPATLLLCDASGRRLGSWVVPGGASRHEVGLTGPARPLGNGIYLLGWRGLRSGTTRSAHVVFSAR
jgi:hypothetical protein